METETITEFADQQIEQSQVKTLTSFDVTKAELIEIASNYKNLVITEETFKDAIKARATIREKRYAIQAQQKQNDSARIAWNKKAMSDNKSKADELLALILPTEEYIDNGIKAIEEAKEIIRLQKEKEEQDRIDARTKLITDTGAILEEDKSYRLGESYIDLIEVKELSDNAFERMVKLFQKEASEIQAKKDAEELEAKAKAERERIEKEQAEAKLKADQEAVAQQKAEQDKKEAELKQKQEALANEREAQLKEFDAKKEAEEKAIQKEKEKVAAEKQQLEKQRADHNRMLQEEADKKAKVESEAIKLKEREARQEALKPDKEKLSDFIKSLGQITGPEVNEKESRELLESVLKQIHDVTIFLSEELKKL